MIGSSYTITEYPGFGMTVSAGLPPSATTMIMQRAEEIMGCGAEDLFMDNQLPRRLGVAMAIGTAESLDKWRAELDKQPVKTATAIPWLDEWLHRGDVGISSASIVSSCLGIPMVRLGMKHWPDGALPRDAPDFTRCRKVVELAAKNGEDFLATLRERPMWAPLVARWDDLCAVEEDYEACTAIIRALAPKGV